MAATPFPCTAWHFATAKNTPPSIWCRAARGDVVCKRHPGEKILVTVN
jgi:hypothetical protein